jgi:HlyD family secretion protein
MSKWIKLGAFLVVALVGSAYFVSAANEEPVVEETAADSEVVARRSLEVTAEAAGIIEPIRVVEVKSKASGEILRLFAETGTAVKRGQLLGEVDPRDVRNAFEQAEADLGVAQARAQTAAAQLQRSQELRKSSVITEQELESAQFENANAQAQLVKAKTNLALAEERLKDVTISAPIDGVIIVKSVEEGAIIQSASQNISGGTAVFLMADLSTMQVRTLVDETDLGKIKPGQDARVTVEAFPGRTFQGVVTKIEPQAVIEQNVTMFPVLVQLANPDGALKPGMNAEVVVEVAQRQSVITVPNASVVATRDANSAGAVFGLSEEQMREAMSAGRPQGANAQAGNAQGGNAQQGGNNAAQPAAGAAQGAGGNQPAAGAQRPAGAQRGAGMGAGGMRRAGGGNAGGGDTRMAVVFVRDAAGVVKPRTVTIGVNDWDYTEVVRGIEEGEQVMLMSVARLQQQQQQMVDRMRTNAGGFPGATTGGPGGGGGNPGAGRAPGGR